MTQVEDKLTTPIVRRIYVLPDIPLSSCGRGRHRKGSQAFGILTESHHGARKTSEIGISEIELLNDLRVEARIISDEVSDGAEHGIEQLPSRTIWVMIASLPKRFSGTPLVLTFDE